MTGALRTRLISTALDRVDSAVTVTAAAATGLTAYRSLHHRPAEARITRALAAGALAAVFTDHHAYRALAPLRRHLGAEQHGAVREPVPAPTPEQLAADLRSDAAHRAASGAARLDYGQGGLTRAANWTGQPDGSATCELTPTAHLLAVPRPTDRDGYSSRSYLLLTGTAATPVKVHSITDLVALLDSPAAGEPQPADDEGDEDGEPWGALGRDLAISPNSASLTRERAARPLTRTRLMSTGKPKPTPTAPSDDTAARAAWCGARGCASPLPRNRRSGDARSAAPSLSGWVRARAAGLLGCRPAPPWACRWGGAWRAPGQAQLPHLLGVLPGVERRRVCRVGVFTGGRSRSFRAGGVQVSIGAIRWVRGWRTVWQRGLGKALLPPAVLSTR
ncbi:hypothetical protein [Kitasatospora sp. DSM 101779]|uniref:hypothetical protein n=1 Tax=Kitasatospora sp. DSM 101779 TaxID=2853165 RepID=UPI0021D89CFA|nr:hypothetical protein [Kitasatospora sp. DSM 101779]MCU7827232.1 hypothetical protein [Kitasatospora sp. DSM 101779]